MNKFKNKYTNLDDNSKIIFAKRPLTDKYPKEDGIFYIYNKLIELENYSTPNMIDCIIDYISFLKKHKIQIIKEFDENCLLSYKGKISNIKVEQFETQSFYGFNKFQIINAETLSRQNIKNELYIKGIDFTYSLDSNAASFFAKYHYDKDHRYKALYNEIINDDNNIDIAPYIFETIMHGLKDFGINYKLNKNNKNKTQIGFFKTISSLYEAGLFKEKHLKYYINAIIKSSNPLIPYYGTLGYTAKIFLLIMLEAKYKFPKSSNKIKVYVYSELRKAKLPIENRLKAILYLFAEDPGHEFFKKVINIHDVKNINKYLHNIDNTARDIALSLLERYFYSRFDIFPFFATDDQGFIKMLQDTKPDYIFKYSDMEIPVYKRINQDMQNKYLEFFESNNHDKGVKYQNTTLNSLIIMYNERLYNFQNEIINHTIEDKK